MPTRISFHRDADDDRKCKRKLPYSIFKIPTLAGYMYFIMDEKSRCFIVLSRSSIRAKAQSHDSKQGSFVCPSQTTRQLIVS